MFIVAALQNVKIADLTKTSGAAARPEDMGDIAMLDPDQRLPDGTEGGPEQVFDRAEEHVLVRESTAGFAGEFARTSPLISHPADELFPDWVVSFFRRVFALYENLPEEGGRRNTTVGVLFCLLCNMLLILHVGWEARGERHQVLKEYTRRNLLAPLRPAL